MRFVFGLCKVLFFICALVIIVLKKRGAELLDPETATRLLQIILPGFFVLAGIMIGWIFAIFFSDDFHPSTSLLMKGFVVGVLLGIGANLLYIFYAGGGVVSV